MVALLWFPQIPYVNSYCVGIYVCIYEDADFNFKSLNGTSIILSMSTLSDLEVIDVAESGSKQSRLVPILLASISMFDR